MLSTLLLASLLLTRLPSSFTASYGSLSEAEHTADGVLELMKPSENSKAEASHDSSMLKSSNEASYDEEAQNASTDNKSSKEYVQPPKNSDKNDTRTKRSSQCSWPPCPDYFAPPAPPSQAPHYTLAPGHHPPLCPSLQPPEGYYNKWEYLKYIAQAYSEDCVHSHCLDHCAVSYTF